MQSIFARTLDAGRRVQGFLDSHIAELGTTVSTSLRAMFDDAVTRLTGFQVEQATEEGTARGETINQATLREELYQRFMVHIGRTAKIELRTSPEFVNLVVPAIEVRKIDFLSTANKFAAAAAKHEPLLVQQGMPVDFLLQLHAAILQVSASADARERSVVRRIAATEGSVVVSKAVREKIGQLDGLIRPALKANGPLLAEWQACKRIRQIGVTPIPTGSPVPVPATPPDVTTPPSQAA